MSWESDEGEFDVFVCVDFAVCGVDDAVFPS